MVSLLCVALVSKKLPSEVIEKGVKNRKAKGIEKSEQEALAA